MYFPFAFVVATTTFVMHYLKPCDYHPNLASCKVARISESWKFRLWNPIS